MEQVQEVGGTNAMHVEIAQSVDANKLFNKR